MFASTVIVTPNERPRPPKLGRLWGAAGAGQVAPGGWWHQGGRWHQGAGVAAACWRVAVCYNRGCNQNRGIYDEETSTVDGIALARYLQPRLAARADAADRSGRLPAADLADLRSCGYLAFTVPRQYGGGGASLQEAVAAQLVLAQGSTATALVAAMQLHLLGYLFEGGIYDEPRLAEFARAAVEDGALFNSVASEPILGSPSRGGQFATTAVRDGGGYRLNGHKNWVTGGAHLTHLLIKLSLDGDAVTMLVPGATPGLRWEATWSDSLSLRASESNDLFLEDAFVPADHLLTATGAGAPQLLVSAADGGHLSGHCPGGA